MADQTNNNRLMCRCKTGFIRYADSCLQGTKNIFRFLRTFIFLYFDILNNNLDLLKSTSAIIKDKSKTKIDNLRNPYLVSKQKTL